MSLIIRVVLVVLMLAAASGARAETESEVMVSVSYDSVAPTHLLLRPFGQDDKVEPIEWEAAQQGLRTSLFVGKLPPGRYELMGIRSVPFAPAVVSARLIDMHWASFEARAGESVDLGRVWLSSLGGNLTLMLRDPKAQPNSILHKLPAGLPVTAPWNTPVSNDEAGLLERAKRRSLVLSRPSETSSGEWLASTSNGEVQRRDHDGVWHIESPATGQLLASFDYLADGNIMVAGEFGQLVYKGSIIGQLPSGFPVHIHCAADLACLVVLAREKDYRVMYSNQVAAGQWQEVALIAKAKSFWSTATPLLVFRSGDETLLFPGKKEMWRLTPMKGALQKEKIDSNVSEVVISAGRITAKNRYSDDGGRSWSKIKARASDGYAQFDDSGALWGKGFEVDWAVLTVVLRRSPDGVGGWKTVTILPVDGVLTVGRFSPVMYLTDPRRPGTAWISSDQGRHWAPDPGLNPFERKL